MRLASRFGNGSTASRINAASSEDAAGEPKTRQGELCIPGAARLRKKRSIQRNPRWHFTQRWPSPKAMKKLRARIREITGKRQSGKDVKQLIAELNPVLRGWEIISVQAMPIGNSTVWITS
jgi:Group II intron, maturase-specific domain